MKKTIATATMTATAAATLKANVTRDAVNLKGTGTDVTTIKTDARRYFETDLQSTMVNGLADILRADAVKTARAAVRSIESTLSNMIDPAAAVVDALNAEKARHNAVIENIDAAVDAVKIDRTTAAVPDCIAVARGRFADAVRRGDNAAAVHDYLDAVGIVSEKSDKLAGRILDRIRGGYGVVSDRKTVETYATTGTINGTSARRISVKTFEAVLRAVLFNVHVIAVVDGVAVELTDNDGEWTAAVV